MPRRRSPEKRKVLPDPKYKDVVLAKFMNNLIIKLSIIASKL